MTDERPILSRISTEWDLIQRAHHGTPTEVTAAQAALMERYSGAVHRYLLAVTRDPNLADELVQEFALRFLRGDLHRADPNRGRFRDFVKRSLRNLMIDHHRARRHHAPLGAPGVPEPAEDDGPSDFERQFTQSWKLELLDQAWAALLRTQERTGRPYYTVLRARVDAPSLKSPELAALLSDRLGKPVTPGWVRETIFRARDQFVAALLDGVRAAIREPTREAILEELRDLRLVSYCRPALRRLGWLP